MWKEKEEKYEDKAEKIRKDKFDSWKKQNIFVTPANKGANPKEWVDSKIKEEWFTCNSGLGVDV